MLKRIGGWFKHATRYSHVRINSASDRFAMIFNEGGSVFTFSLMFHRVDFVKKYSRAPKPCFWMFRVWLLGRCIALPIR